MKSKLFLTICLMLCLLQGCNNNLGFERKDDLSATALSPKGFSDIGTAISTSGKPFLELVITDFDTQLLQKDFGSNFTNWHGQPLWDKALVLEKDKANAVVLVPTSKDSDIAAFIAATVKDGVVNYELHRRSAIKDKVVEPTLLKINYITSQLLLAYFNNIVHGKVDEVDQDAYYTALNSTPPSIEQASRVQLNQICWNVGYCEDCPGSPTVCCYTTKVCVSIWYDDGISGIGNGGTSGPVNSGSGSGTSNPDLSGNPGPGPCSSQRDSWYSQRAEGYDCSDCQNIHNSTTAQNILINETTISETSEERTKMYKYKIVQGAFSLWYVTCTLKGVHKKVNNPDPNLQWEWKSLEKISHGLIGGTVGGSIEIESCIGTPTLGRYNAFMDMETVMKFSAACKGSPFAYSNPYRSVLKLNMNTAPIQGY